MINNNFNKYLKKSLEFMLNHLLILTVFLTPNICNAQTILEIEPLFEYPIAPEELPTLTEKSNYLVEHFWDNFDFKNNSSVDQLALNDAFKVFLTPLRWSDYDKSNSAINKLIDKISGNPTLLFQFTKAAEENLYGPRAEVWSDDIYIKFINATLKNKKIPEKRKINFRKQADIIQNTKIGATAPTFSFTNKNLEKSTYFPMSTPTLLIFGNPEDTDWRIARLKTETNSILNDALDKGKLNILFIIPIEIEDWREKVSGYSSKWVIGKGENISDIYDLRAFPAIYVIGNDGKIIMKNISLDTAIQTALENIN